MTLPLTSVATYRRLLDYDDWANRETLSSLQPVGALPPALRRMAHIIAARRLWLDRLYGRQPSVPIWPDWTLDACDQRLEASSQAWQTYLAGLDDGLDREITYTNSKGEPWSNRVSDVLMHVVVHGGYHRGQIASDVRAAGHTPAYTDFIHAVRQGIL